MLKSAGHEDHLDLFWSVLMRYSRTGRGWTEPGKCRVEEGMPSEILLDGFEFLLNIFT